MRGGGLVDFGTFYIFIFANFTVYFTVDVRILPALSYKASVGKFCTFAPNLYFPSDLLKSNFLQTPKEPCTLEFKFCEDFRSHSLMQIDPLGQKRLCSEFSWSLFYPHLD